MFGTVNSRSTFTAGRRTPAQSDTMLDLTPFLPVKPRTARATLFLNTAIVATLAGLGVADRAAAQGVDACGPPAADGRVVCRAEGNPFADGIMYRSAPSDPADPLSAPLDLSVLVESGVAAILPAGAPATAGIDLTAGGTAAISLLSQAGSSVTTGGAGTYGVRVRAAAGDVSILAPDVSTAGDGARGIGAATSDGGSIAIESRSVTTSGYGARGIDARTTGGGDVAVTAGGPIATLGDASSGLVANATDAATVRIGDVSTAGAYSDAVAAIGGGDVSIVASGSIGTQQDRSYGIYLDSGGTATVRLDGAIETLGLGARGISVFGSEGASVIGRGSVATEGAIASGVVVRSNEGDVLVDLARVTTTAAGVSGANGISAVSGGGDVTVRIRDASTRGDFVRTVSASSTDGTASIDSTGAIAAAGRLATAVDVQAGELARVSVHDVTVTGPGATAIRAEGETVEIAIGGAVSASGGGSDGFAIRALGERAYLPGPEVIGPDGETTSTGAYAETGGDIAIVNNGTVQASGDGLGAISAQTLGNVTISGNGGVTIRGDDATGIRVDAGEDVSITTGSIAIDGNQSTGIAATGRTIDIRTGAVTASGVQARGITARAADTLSLSIDGPLTINGAYSTGIAVDSERGIDLRATGPITIGADRFASAARVTSLGDIHADFGDITSSADGVFMVEIIAGDAGSSDVRFGAVTSTGTMTSGISISGSSVAAEIAGPLVNEYGGAISIIADRNGAGSLTVHDVRAGAFDNATIIVGGGSATLDLEGDFVDDLVRTGTLSHPLNTAIAIDAAGDGLHGPSDATLHNNGSILTQTDRATGVALRSGRDVLVDGGGTITTLGYESVGMRVLAAGNVDVTHGAISTQGDFSAALRVTDADISHGIGNTYDATGPIRGDLRLDVGALSTAGLLSEGLFANVAGAADVALASVTTTGLQSIGVSITAGGDVTLESGDILVTGGGRTSGLTIDAGGNLDLKLANVTMGEAGRGVGINAFADGDISINAGSISTAGARGSFGIFASAPGTVAITAEAITTDGPISHGIWTGGATGDVAAGTIETRGDGSHGLFAQFDGDVAIDVRTVSTQGTDSIGVNATSASGSIAIQAGKIATTGGRSVTSSYDDDYGEVILFGSSAQGVRAQARDDVAISVDSVSTQGDGAIGVNAASLYGSATMAANAISTQGLTAHGALARAYGDLTVAVGSVSTAGESARGVDAASMYGTTTVLVGQAATTGYAADAVRVNGGGPVRIALASGSVSGDYSTGISATSSHDVEIVLGDLAVGGFGSGGVSATSLSNVAIRVTGNVTGSSDHPVPEEVIVGPGGRVQDPAQAIIGANAFDTATLIHDGVIVTTGTLEGGIGARGVNGVTVSGNGSVSTSGQGATGVYAGANTGTAAIVIGNVTTAGADARGLHARGYGVAWAVADAVKTSGDRSIAVLSEGGLASYAQAESVSTSGAGAHGVVSHSYGDAYARADTIAVTGSGAIGMNVASYGQGDTIAIARNVRVSNGRGVEAFATSGAASVYADSVVQADNAGGGAIAASGSAGATIGFGSVRSSGAGASAAVFASTDGGVITIGGDTLAATGADRDGVLALSNSGDIAIGMAGALTTEGAGSSGIFARTGGAIDITAISVTSKATDDAAITGKGGSVAIRAGSVTASGDNQTVGRLAAIEANAGRGAAAVTVGSVISSGIGRDGVAVTAATTGSIAIFAGGGISATGDAMVLATGGGARIVNAGTVTSGGAAVRAQGGPATIVNTGSMTGALLLTDGADSVTNDGILRLAEGTNLGGGDDMLVNTDSLILSGTVDFGAGSDRLINSGTISLGAARGGIAARAVAPISRTITGIDSFANNGRIDLVNGTAGDVLNLSGAFTGSGASTLALDVSFAGTSIADRLVIAGAATGSTIIAMSPIDAPQLTTKGPVLVQAGAGTAATAVALDARSANLGLFQAGLAFDAASSSFSLAIAPSASAYRLLNAGEGAQSLWIETADSVAAHLNADRSDTAGGFWFSATGNVSRRREARTFRALGFAQTADLGYRQDVFGGQFGYDLGGTRHVRFGVTGGYANSTLGFAGVADRIAFDAWNVGAYARLTGGRAFAHALVKADFYDVDARLGHARAKADGQTYGGWAEAGVHLGSPGFSIEPVVSLSWQHVDLGGLDLPLAVDFEDRQGGRASAGLRLGSTSDIGDGARLTLYAQGDYVQPFGGQSATVFTSGPTSLAFDDQRIGTYGKGKVGASITSGRVTGFFEGEGRASREYRGAGARAGLRIGF